MDGLEEQKTTLTPEEEKLAEQIAEQMTGLTPAGQEKHNVHTFLHSVALAEDTTKLGFLTKEELGQLSLTVRGCKELGLISKKIMLNPYFMDYFLEQSEIMTSTSLSREAKLLELAVITRREVADVTKPRKENKSWFKKKSNEPPQGEAS